MAVINPVALKLAAALVDWIQSAPLGSAWTIQYAVSAGVGIAATRVTGTFVAVGVPIVKLPVTGAAREPKSAAEPRFWYWPNLPTFAP